MKNPFSFFRNTKTGLILGSGGSKGISHIAVIDYLESMNVSIDMIAGSSIGAVVGAIYACGNLTQFKEDILNIKQKELFSFIDPVFPRRGFIEGRYLLKFLRKYIPKDKKIEDLNIPLSMVATDFKTGNSIIFRKGNVLEAIRASISIPGVFVPVIYKNTFLLDGGVANPLPINVAKRMGAGLTIAVNLHPAVPGRKLKNFIMDKSGNREVLVDSEDIEFIDQEKFSEDIKGDNWIKSIEKKLKHSRSDESDIPSIFETISKSADIMEYNNTMLMLKVYKPSVLIEPDLVNLGTLDFSDISSILTEGYRASGRVRGKIIRNVKIWK